MGLLPLLFHRLLLPELCQYWLARDLVALVVVSLFIVL